MQEAFEAAIREKPDEIAAYAAYADWLQEQDDSRGEFMQVQLALENESLPKEERKRLQEREAELLKEHERKWLGELAPHMLERDERNDRLLAEHVWRRGFFHGLTAHRLSTALTYALTESPVARRLSELRVFDTELMYYGVGADHPPFRVPTPPGVRDHWELLELIGTPLLQNIQYFQMGNEEPPEDGWCDCHCYPDGLEHAIAGMSRIEELHLLCKGYDLWELFSLANLTNLRVLRAYHVGWYLRAGEAHYEYPLDILADNPAFANLTHLQFHPHWAESRDASRRDRSHLPLPQVRSLVKSPHLKKLTHLQLRLSDMGDDGVREIIASGILKQLKWLDLRHGCITDEGAKLFAACPDTQNLERLDLSRNGVSAEGLQLLRKAKINAVANQPLTEQELTEREYLREGDFE